MFFLLSLPPSHRCPRLFTLAQADASLPLFLLRHPSPPLSLSLPSPPIASSRSSPPRVHRCFSPSLSYRRPPSSPASSASRRRRPEVANPTPSWADLPPVARSGLSGAGCTASRRRWWRRWWRRLRSRQRSLGRTARHHRVRLPLRRRRRSFSSSSDLLGLGVEGKNPWVGAVSTSHSPGHGAPKAELGSVAQRKGAEERRETRPLQRGHCTLLGDGSGWKGWRREPKPLAKLPIVYALSSFIWRNYFYCKNSNVLQLNSIKQTYDNVIFSKEWAIYILYSMRRKRLEYEDKSGPFFHPHARGKWEAGVFSSLHNSRINKAWKIWQDGRCSALLLLIIFFFSALPNPKKGGCFARSLARADGGGAAATGMDAMAVLARTSRPAPTLLAATSPAVSRRPAAVSFAAAAAAAASPGSRGRVALSAAWGGRAARARVSAAGRIVASSVGDLSN